MTSPSIVLACHGLDGERTVGREQVSWNHAPARYPWLLGMPATERIAMLEAAMLYDCLRQL